MIQSVQTVLTHSTHDPECYRSNKEPYPLCVGNGSQKCKSCNIYEDYEMYHDPNDYYGGKQNG